MTDTSDSNFLNKLQLEKELYFFTSVDGHSDTRDNKHLLINQSAVSKIKKITKKKKKEDKENEEWKHSPEHSIFVLFLC